jgi:hypothetical protein
VFRAFAAALLLALCVSAVAAAVAAAHTLWYVVVDPVASSKLLRLSGTLIQVSGECPNVKGGTVLTLRIRGDDDLVFSLRCGRELRNQLAQSVGMPAVADYRFERDLLFWVKPRLYGLRSGDQVFVPRSEGSVPVTTTVVSLLAVAISCLAAFYAGVASGMSSGPA